MTDKVNRRPDKVALASSGYAPVRLRLGMADFLVQLWRSKWLILAFTAPILAVGVFFASNAPTQFESRAVLYVTGDGSNPGDFHSAESEREILKTRLVAERALSRFPLSRIYPRLSAAQDRALSRTPERTTFIREGYFQKGVDAFQRGMLVIAVPDSNILDVRVSHDDPQIASELLNATIAVYLQRREELFADRPSTPEPAGQKTVEADLLDAEDAIRAFLSENTIRDFDGEFATAQGLYALISNELTKTEARQAAVRGQLRRLRTQLAETPQVLDLFVEDSTADRMFDLEIERNEALVTYLPDSQRVQTLDAQIAALRSRLETPDKLEGTVRRGLNPTYQALEVSRNKFEADADSLARERAELSRQMVAVEEKLERFTGLQSEWNRLQRARDIAAARIFSNTRPDDARDAQAGDSVPVNRSVRIAEPATLPRTGRSAALPIIFLSALVAFFLASTIALLRMRSLDSFATPSSFRRTTGLPLLAEIGRA